MNPKLIRVGLVGCGRFGSKRAHALMKTVPYAFLHCVYDKDEQKARNFAQQWGIQHCSSLEEMAQDPCIDLVIVAVPNAYHLQVCTPFLESSKHVLCEKPLAHNLSDASQLVLLAQKSRAQFKVGSNLRFFPIMLKLKELVLAGELGQIKRIRASIGHDGAPVKGRWFMQKDVSGGGCFLDNGTHLIDYCQDLVGDFVEGRIENKTLSPLANVEDYCLGVFRSSQGVEVSVEASWKRQKGYVDIIVEGELATLKADAHLDYLEIRHGQGPGWKKLVVNNKEHSLELELKYLIDCIQHGKVAGPTAEGAYKTMEMVYKAYN